MKNANAALLERAYLEIGNICNLDCSFCVKCTRPRKFMTKEEIRATLAKLVGRVKFVYLHVLGEPLLHPELENVLSFVREFGMKACITTNGTLLKTRGEILLANSEHLHKVSVSLHAPEGNGITDFDEYLTSVCRFARAAAERGIFTVLRLWNLDSELHSGKNSQNEKIKTTLQKELGDGWVRRGQGYRIRERIFIEYGEVFEWPAESSGEARERLYCHALSSQVAILADGTVVPCCLDANGEMPLGNIFDSTLDGILSGERATAIREGFVRREAVEELCKRCTYARRFKV